MAEPPNGAPRRSSLDVDVVAESASTGDLLKAQQRYLIEHGDRTIKTILLLVAMEAEAAPIVQSLNLKRDDPPVIAPPAPCVSYSGEDFGAKIHLVCFGKCKEMGVDHIGTVPAALTTYLAIQAFQPDVVISAGTCGGFAAKGAKISDVFVSTRMVNHDRRIPLPGFHEYGLGVLEALPTPRMVAALGLKTGVVSSGNSLDYTGEDMARMLEHGTACKEMEAAAVAWAADLFHTPCFCIKSVTDIVDGEHPPEKEFLANLARAAAELQRVVPKALELIAGRRYGEL